MRRREFLGTIRGFATVAWPLEMAWRTLHVRISTVCVLGARARVFPAREKHNEP